MDPAVEIENATHRFVVATASYMVRLESIIGSLKTLATGSHGFDYAVNVSHAEKPRILPLLADLTFDIESEFGVTIKSLAVAHAGNIESSNYETIGVANEVVGHDYATPAVESAVRTTRKSLRKTSLE